MILMRAVIGSLLLGATSNALAQQHDHSEHQHAPAAPAATGATSAHVPPDPPAHLPEPMSNEQMVEMMQMDDAARFGSVVFDQLEWRERDESIAWEGSAWYGGDYNRALMKTEGAHSDDGTHARTEVLWDHAIAPWWSLLTGVRHDSGGGPSRTWAAIGVAGVAPWWFDLDATLYVGEQQRTAARFEARYELRLTQRLILQPQLEANLYGKDDPQRHLGSGLSNLTAALRLRYEMRREFAPYIGVHFTGLFGDTADLARTAGGDDTITQFVAGVHFWF